MYWTTGAYSITVNGNPQFQDANPAAGIPNGTVLNADWHNNVTNELVNVVQGGGFAPSDTDQTQVLAAIEAIVGLGANGQTTFSADYSMIAPSAGSPGDFGKILIFTGTTAATVTLAAAESAPTAWQAPVVIINQGTADLTYAAPTGDAINGATNFVLAPNESVAVRPQGSTKIWQVLFSTGGLVKGGVANMVVITSSGTYTPSAGVTYAVVEVQGAGGAQSGRNGGGAGTYFRGVLSASQLGASQSVTIGAGGASGGNGGATSFGALISCPGGLGAAAGNAGAPTLAAGVAGFTLIGSSGSPGTDGASSYPRNGAGTGSYFGGGTLTVATAAPGAGGNTGGAGIVIVTEFFS